MAVIMQLWFARLRQTLLARVTWVAPEARR